MINNKKNNYLEWTPVAILPPVIATDLYSPASSGSLLVFRKCGNICVARYETWNFDDDEPNFHWVTDDSEGWRIDGEVTHWMQLPNRPE